MDEGKRNDVQSSQIRSTSWPKTFSSSRDLRAQELRIFAHKEEKKLYYRKATTRMGRVEFCRSLLFCYNHLSSTSGNSYIVHTLAILALNHILLK